MFSSLRLSCFLHTVAVSLFFARFALRVLAIKLAFRLSIACRCSSFLCTEYLARDFSFDYSEGICRVSLAHYNTISDIKALAKTLESTPGWR